MRDQTIKVGTRTEHETFVAMRFTLKATAESVWHVLGALHRDGELDVRCVVGVFENPPLGKELVLVLPAGSDIEAQLDAIVKACLTQCNLNVRRRDMKPADYGVYESAMRAARSQLN